MIRTRFVVALALLPAPLAAQSVTSAAWPGGGAADAAPRLGELCGPVEPAVQPLFDGRTDLMAHASLYGCTAPSPSPWTVGWSPDGALYMTLFGGVIGSSNCLVARLDPVTLAPLAVIPVGQGPEEIVFTETSGGTLAYAFVTASSSSTVSVFDAAETVVATIPIPTTSPWGTAFPFGMAVSPDGSRVHVGTNDGSGKVYAIDTSTLALVPSETMSFGVGRGFGRMLFAGETLVLTMTTSDPGFTGSTAHVVFVDPAHPRLATIRTITGVHDGSAYPSPSDVARFCGDQVFVSGFDMGRFVYVFDAGARALVDVVPTETSQALGKLHGLAVGPSGLGVVTDFISDEVSWFDAATRTHLGVTDLSTHGWNAQAGDAVFAPDGARLLVTCQGSSSLVRFALP